jgi:hypothetical protein
VIADHDLNVWRAALNSGLIPPGRNSNPQGAYDAMPPLVRKLSASLQRRMATDGDDDKATELLQFLRSRLDNDALAELLALADESCPELVRLAEIAQRQDPGLFGGGGEDQDDEDDDPRITARGRMAGDATPPALQSTYAERWPQAARIRIDHYGERRR